MGEMDCSCNPYCYYYDDEWRCCKDACKHAYNACDPTHPNKDPICVKLHGNWSSWSDWTDCQCSFGSPIQSRSRSCTNPAPNVKLDGNPKLGCPKKNGTEFRECFNQGFKPCQDWMISTVALAGVIGVMIFVIGFLSWLYRKAKSVASNYRHHPQDPEEPTSTQNPNYSVVCNQADGSLPGLTAGNIGSFSSIPSNDSGHHTPEYSRSDISNIYESDHNRTNSDSTDSHRSSVRSQRTLQISVIRTTSDDDDHPYDVIPLEVPTLNSNFEMIPRTGSQDSIEGSVVTGVGPIYSVFEEDRNPEIALPPLRNIRE